MKLQLFSSDGGVLFPLFFPEGRGADEMHPFEDTTPDPVLHGQFSTLTVLPTSIPAPNTIHDSKANLKPNGHLNPNPLYNKT